MVNTIPRQGGRFHLSVDCHLENPISSPIASSPSSRSPRLTWQSPRTREVQPFHGMGFHKSLHRVGVHHPLGQLSSVSRGYQHSCGATHVYCLLDMPVQMQNINESRPQKALCRLLGGCRDKFTGRAFNAEYDAREGSMPLAGRL